MGHQTAPPGPAQIYLAALTLRHRLGICGPTRYATKTSFDLRASSMLDTLCQTMNASERDPYLVAIDALLVPIGFKRKKKEFLWSRTMDRDTEWIHVNFGKEVINPSYGINFDDLQTLFPKGLGVTCGSWYMLQGLTGTMYSATATPPAVIARDLAIVLEELPKLHDRGAFTEILLGEIRAGNPVILFADRMRLLPLMLAHLGRIDEAFASLARFELIALERDQALPPYSVYAAHFRSVFHP